MELVHSISGKWNPHDWDEDSRSLKECLRDEKSKARSKKGVSKISDLHSMLDSPQNSCYQYRLS
jgi:hypothetical protein